MKQLMLLCSNGASPPTYVFLERDAHQPSYPERRYSVMPLRKSAKACQASSPRYSALYMRLLTAPVNRYAAERG